MKRNNRLQSFQIMSHPVAISLPYQTVMLKSSNIIRILRLVVEQVKVQVKTKSIKVNTIV
jgi:hypothetical protein